MESGSKCKKGERCKHIIKDSLKVAAVWGCRSKQVTIMLSLLAVKLKP